MGRGLITTTACRAHSMQTRELGWNVASLWAPVKITSMQKSLHRGGKKPADICMYSSG